MSKKRDDQQLPLPFPDDGQDPHIPEGWVWTTLGGIGEWSGGGTPSKKQPEYWEEGTIPWVSPKDMKVSELAETEDSITNLAVEESSAKLIPSGSILFVTRSGILRHTLPVAVNLVDVTINQDMKALTPYGDIDPKYSLYYALAHNSEILHKCAKQGTTVQSIVLKRLSNYPLPLAPLGEQKRIVYQLETHLQRIHTIQTQLQTIQQALVYYREAVLNAAFSGQLTADWREMHPIVTPVEKTLDEILRLRPDDWQENNPRKKYKPPKQQEDQKDAIDLPELPETWQYINSDNLFAFVTSGSRGWSKYYAPSGAQFIRVGNLNHGSITLDLKEVQHINPPESAERDRTLVKPGDILISITADVGMVALIPDEIEESYVNQHVAIARPVRNVYRRFLAWFLVAPEGGQAHFYEFQYGVTKAGLGLQGIKSIAFPFPPIEEQHEIVHRIEKQLQLANTIEQRVEEVLVKTEQTKQAVLEQAFRGELVPTEAELARQQERSYEPAWILLERIQAERAEQATTKKSRALSRRPKTKRRGMLTLDDIKTTHLADILQERDTPLAPEALWRASQLTIDDFYAQLKREVDRGAIREDKQQPDQSMLELAA